MSLKKYFLQIVLFICIHASCLLAYDVSNQKGIAQILPLRDRARIQNDWLKWRFDNILPELMRDAGIDLWLIVNREYNEDPVYFTLSPQPTIYSYRTTILMLHDKGNRTGVERLSGSDHGNFRGLLFRQPCNPPPPLRGLLVARGKLRHPPLNPDNQRSESSTIAACGFARTRQNIESCPSNTQPTKPKEKPARPCSSCCFRLPRCCWSAAEFIM